MKIVNSILVVLFLVFTYVQFNDPDPVLWVFIYLNITAICLVSIFGLQYKFWIIPSMIFYAGYAILLLGGAWEWIQSPDRSLLFDDIAKMQYPYIEETREFLGLVISIVAAAIQLFVGKKG